MAFERDGTRKEALAYWHNHLSPTLLGTFVNGFLDGFLVFSSGVSGLCPTGCNIHFVGAKLRLTDTLLNLPVELIVPSVGKSRHRDEERKQK